VENCVEAEMVGCMAEALEANHMKKVVHAAAAADESYCTPAVDLDYKAAERRCDCYKIVVVVNSTETRYFAGNIFPVFHMEVGIVALYDKAVEVGHSCCTWWLEARLGCCGCYKMQ